MAVLLDLDGTLYAGEEAVPGAADTLTALRDRGTTLRFLTNTDSRPPEAVLEELAEYGFDIAPDELFTPIVAAEQLLEGLPEVRLHTMVAPAVRSHFARFGGAAPYTHVLIGDCREALDYAALDAAFRALRGGAELVALQRGRYYKRADGDHVDAGAVVAGLEYAADLEATVVGKPSGDFFALCLRSADATAEDSIVVGDDVSTDIAGGRAAGLRTVLVRTGKYADAPDGADDDADHVIDSVADLPGLLDELK
jgi:HAD superfamily hydrolase (TIGR01458 family)